MKKLILALFVLNGVFLGSSAFADHDYRYGYYSSDEGYYYNPYYTNRGVYSSGYYFDPYMASHGSYEGGAGVHVPTGSYASPYQHGVHHGYHYSQEEGWHSGSHYGHE